MARSTKQVGVLWRKTKNKRTYFTGFLNLGVLGDVPIGIFPIDAERRTSDQSPDYAIVLLQERREDPDKRTDDAPLDDIPLPS
jgi:hypothetical protein